jgi:uncharacterized protein (TIGR00645 family)
MLPCRESMAPTGVPGRWVCAYKGASPPADAFMKSIADLIELVIFSSRWLVVPFLFGLIVGLAALLIKFVIKLAGFVVQVWTSDPSEVIVGILGLVDLTLTANLIVIVVCSSYENFVRPIDTAKHPGWPQGLVMIGFSGLKQKLLGSIVAIAAVNALEWFTDIDRQADSLKLGWVVGILLTFAIAMLVLAVADRVASGNGKSQ